MYLAISAQIGWKVYNQADIIFPRQRNSNFLNRMNTNSKHPALQEYNLKLIYP